MAAKFAVDGDQYRKIDRRMCEIKRMLNQEGGCPIYPDQIALALQDIIEGKIAKRYESLIDGLFTSPEKQIQKVREWNREFGWDIPEEAFDEAERSIPVWPATQLVAVVLVPYLADKKEEDDTVMSGLERTFHELWMRASAEQDANCRWDGYNKAGSDRLRLLKGIEHKVGLRWEVIDLGCYRNRGSKSSPSAGILAAAALHPQWVKSMDGDKVPYVWIPGYEVQAPYYKPWAGMPYLCFDRVNRKVDLRYCWSGSNLGPNWAVPSFFRE